VLRVVAQADVENHLVHDRPAVLQVPADRGRERAPAEARQDDVLIGLGQIAVAAIIEEGLAAGIFAIERGPRIATATLILHVFEVDAELDEVVTRAARQTSGVAAHLNAIELALADEAGPADAERGGRAG